MNLEQQLSNLLKNKTSAPFLFLGSGFSKRYINLESWEGLLSKFCLNLKNYSYYKSKANGCIEQSARHLADDFFEHWWNHESYIQSREENPQLDFKDSPLRYEIAKYLKSKTEDVPLESLGLYEELKLLKRCQIDGVITTNWDLLAEKIFPNYEVYKGQQDVLYSNIMNVGEIYKIHGCCTKIQSMILTDHDYEDFNKKNAYLASKLITIFVEHPVIFIGYSLNDKNIRSILYSIALCSGQENLEKLRNNLIFVSRLKDDTEPRIENSSITIDHLSVPIKLVKAKDFSPIYKALGKFERQLPAHILRMCKERVYEVVNKVDPKSKIAVIDYDQIDNFEDVEIVFGLGITKKLGMVGYDSIDNSDLIHNAIFLDKQYESEHILKLTLPSINKSTKYVPVFKYLKDLGIRCLDDYPYDKELIKKFIGIKKNGKLRELKREDFTSVKYHKFNLKYQSISFKNFLESATEYDFVTWLPYFEDIDLEELRNYLKEKHDIYKTGSYGSAFRRAVAFYDWLENGQDFAIN